MSGRPAVSYETLARMLERELELLEQGRLDELAELSAAREELIARLPAIPPAAARPALQRALVTQERIRKQLLDGREAALGALADVRNARRIAEGYAPARRRPPRISASA